MRSGLEGAKLVHQGTVAAFPDLHFEIEDLIAGISVFRIVGDRVVERWANQDNLGFYQQLGIPLSAA